MKHGGCFVVPTGQPVFSRRSERLDEREGTAGAEVGSTPVNWLGALGLGLGAAIGTAMAWALIAAVTGYVFGIAAVFIGILIAYSVAKGAKHITFAVIVLDIALTLLAVVLGDILGLTLVLVWAGYDATFLGVLVHYPEIVSLAPGEAFVVYLFGFLGTAAGARRLYRLMKRQAEAAALASWVSTPASTPAIATEAPKTEILEQTAAVARARVNIPMTPPHSVEATLDATSRHASIRLDASPFSDKLVSDKEMIVQVPLEGAPSHVLNVRFWRADRPRIDVRLDGTLIGQA